MSVQKVAIEHFRMGPDMQQIPFALVDTQTVVSEQWVDYDRDLIASQIAAFNQLDSSSRPGCAAQEAPAAVSTYEPPPSCLAANYCALPW
jgi:hypothetical protein